MCIKVKTKEPKHRNVYCTCSTTPEQTYVQCKKNMHTERSTQKTLKLRIQAKNEQ